MTQAKVLCSSRTWVTFSCRLYPRYSCIHLSQASTVSLSSEGWQE